MLVPRLVPALKRSVRALVAGGFHTLALMSDGSLVGFGRGASGAASADSCTPVSVQLPDGCAPIATLAAGRAHSLALLEDGSVLSWGAAESGQCGLGDTTDALTPQSMPSLPNVGEGGVGSGCVQMVVAGGSSSALLLGKEAAQGAPRTPTTLGLPMVQRLLAKSNWSSLSSAVSAVFSSPALCNASFAGGASTELNATELEAVYTSLLRSFEHEASVLHALRDSMPALLDALEACIADSSAGTNGLPIPSHRPRFQNRLTPLTLASPVPSQSQVMSFSHRPSAGTRRRPRRLATRRAGLSPSARIETRLSSHPLRYSSTIHCSRMRPRRQPFIALRPS